MCAAASVLKFAPDLTHSSELEGVLQSKRTEGVG